MNYRFNLSRLSYYDWFILGRYAYDKNPWNFYYIASKAAEFDINSLPVDELIPMYLELGGLITNQLQTGQDEISEWVERKIEQFTDPPMPKPFKNFFDRLSDSGIDNSQ